MESVQESWSIDVIAVDTNVVVRLLTKDHEEQYQKSFMLFQEQNVFIVT